MAEEISSFLDETQDKLNTLLRSVVERWNEERERANQQRDELLMRHSQAQERENDLTRTVSEQNERIRELEQTVTDKRARALKARKRVHALDEKIKNMKEASDGAIREEWHKAQRLKTQRDTITQNQIEIDELRERLRLSHVQLSQRDSQVIELKRELECSRKTNQETEMASRQKVEELRGSFEAEKRSLRAERQAAQQRLERLKKQSGSKMAKKEQEIAFQKAELCDLHATASEVREELRQTRLEIGSHSTILAQKDREVSVLLQSIASLKAENEMALQETRGRLVEAQFDTTSFREKLEIAAHELQDARKELAAIRTSATALSTMGGGADVIRSIGNHLRQLSQRSGKFCDPAHSKYLYLTDCGTFLCFECLQQALPEGGGDMPLTIGSKVAFEINCPWCRSEFWTWEALAIPYSTSWIEELDSLTGIIDTFECSRTIVEKRMVVEEL
jgi:chromosome segregation ATPase